MVKTLQAENDVLKKKILKLKTKVANQLNINSSNDFISTPPPAADCNVNYRTILLQDLIIDNFQEYHEQQVISTPLVAFCMKFLISPASTM